jgi:hypothetical protein
VFEKRNAVRAVRQRRASRHAGAMPEMERRVEGNPSEVTARQCGPGASHA